MDKDTKKKAVAAAAGAGAILSILSATKYEDPAELIKKEMRKADENAIEEKVTIEKTSIKESAFDKIPALLRTFFLLPMWLIGHLLIKLFDNLFKLVASPVLMFLLSTLIIFLILLAIVVLFIKLLYPNLSIKKILTKKLIIILLISSLALNGVDRLLLAINEGYQKYREILKFGLGLLLLVLVLLNVIKRKLKEEKEPKIIYDEI